MSRRSPEQRRRQDNQVALVAAGLLLVAAYQQGKLDFLPYVNDGVAAAPTDTSCVGATPEAPIRSSGMVYDSGECPEIIEQWEDCGNNTNKILLTFDDGGSDGHIRAIMDTLAGERVPEEDKIGAIFFPNSDPNREDVPQYMVDELRSNGFWVGNHTASHPFLKDLSQEGIVAAINSGYQSSLFRPPYGGSYSNNREAYFDNRVSEAAQSAGVRICLWTIDTMDWDERSEQQIIDSVLNSLTADDGQTVLMHMQDSYASLDALPDIIEGARAMGYEFCAHPDGPTTADIPEVLPC